jgi:hypothetical protein
VSAVPDEQSAEVGGLQNTVTNLGASIGTALSGAVLISALTTSLIAGIQNNPAVPADVKSKAKTELASGVPFLSDKDLQAALDKAGVPEETADAIVDENSTARLDALRSSLSVIAVVALMALYFGGGIPLDQPAGAALRGSHVTSARHTEPPTRTLSRGVTIRGRKLNRSCRSLRVVATVLPFVF